MCMVRLEGIEEDDLSTREQQNSGSRAKEVFMVKEMMFEDSGLVSGGQNEFSICGPQMGLNITVGPASFGVTGQSCLSQNGQAYNQFSVNYGAGSIQLNSGSDIKKPVVAAAQSVGQTLVKATLQVAAGLLWGR
jgi:hypothetical protein